MDLNNARHTQLREIKNKIFNQFIWPLEKNIMELWKTLWKTQLDCWVQMQWYLDVSLG